MAFNLNLFNVILTGVAFFLLFTAFQTASQVSQIVLESAAKETGQDVGVGYISLSILYASFAVFNWFSPVFIYILSEKYTMFLGSLCYVYFVACFMEPRAWSIYIGSIINGFGASLLWTGQGSFISRCSDERSINRYFSIFWGLFQCSQLIGGLYAYFSLTGVTYIQKHVRLQLFGGLLGCGTAGSLTFLGLKRKPSTSMLEGNDENAETSEVSFVRPSCGKLFYDSTVKTLCRSIQLLPSRIMLCILLAAAFIGVNTTFWSNLFATCMGHTQAFGVRAKSSMGLIVLFVGLGEILGSAVNGLRRWLTSAGLATCFGYAASIIAGFLAFIMLPSDSPIRESDAQTYIRPSLELGMFIAVLFGMVDAVWNTQMSVLIGDVYRSQQDDVPVAFALYRCTQAIFAAITFAYCNQLLLQWHVLIYALWATAAIGGFLYASWLQSVNRV